jgi:Protein kinase domain
LGIGLVQGPFRNSRYAALLLVRTREVLQVARTPLRDEDPSWVGRYRLMARLGSGGMGVVYLGVAEGGYPVAVKVLRPELADDQEFRARFRREVAVLTKVRGICTVPVIEADTDSPRPFLVTEYADGPSLAEHVRAAGPLRSELLYGLATGLAEALTAIHEAGIIHRDLKPANVLLTSAGPKVIDFGIAQAMDATVLTRTGMTIGSPGFMAPEQITGQAGHAADIFSWGLTVAFAANGESPFGTGPTDAILFRILHGNPDISGVPEELRLLVLAALAKNPDERPSARDLLGWLTQWGGQSESSLDASTQTVLTRTWLLSGSGDPRDAWDVQEAPSPGEGWDPRVGLGSGEAQGPRRRARGTVVMLSVAAVLAAVVGAGVALALDGTRHPGANAAGISQQSAHTGTNTGTATATKDISGTVTAADGFLAKLGYAPQAGSPRWEPSAPLNVIVAANTSGADGLSRAFFFHDGKFAGTDS